MGLVSWPCPAPYTSITPRITWRCNSSKGDLGTSLGCSNSWKRSICSLPASLPLPSPSPFWLSPNLDSYRRGSISSVLTSCSQYSLLALLGRSERESFSSIRQTWQSHLSLRIRSDVRSTLHLLPNRTCLQPDRFSYKSPPSPRVPLSPSPLHTLSALNLLLSSKIASRCQSGWTGWHKGSEQTSTVNLQCKSHARRPFYHPLYQLWTALPCLTPCRQRN